VYPPDVSTDVDAVRSPREQTLRWSGVWVLFVVVLLAALRLLTLELFFVVAYIGVLAISGVYAPRPPAPRWWRRLRLLLAAGFVVLAYVVVEQALQFL
jgi:hypothetical protein